jgi:hypothetical protein
MPAKPRHTIAIFGEAEKGQFKRPYTLREMTQLVDAFGNPPVESQGLFYAVQAILYQRELIFFRVEEEGFSTSDYLFGLNYLENLANVERLHALCLPGVGDAQIIKNSLLTCSKRKSLLVITPKDLYDYLTS